MTLTTGVWLGACSTGDDNVCEVACHCDDQTQYRGAGFCDRETLTCVSGLEECAALCEENGGLEQLCSKIKGQPVGHTAPSLICPGDDPVDRNCDPDLNGCAIDRGASPLELLGALAFALVLPLWRRRRVAQPGGAAR